MVPLSAMALRRVQKDPEAARQRTLEALKQFQSAHDKLERICREKGIPVPVIVM